MELYMRIAPELYLKRLLVGGFGGQHLVGGIHRVYADPLLGGHRAAARQRGAGRALPGADLIGQGGIQLLIQRGLCARVQFYHGKPFLLAP